MRTLMVVGILAFALSAQASEDMPIKAKALWDAAKKVMKKKPAEAEPVLKEAVETYGESAAMRADYAQVLEKLDRTQDALEQWYACKRILEKEDKLSSKEKRLLKDSESRIKKLDAARKVIKEALDLLLDNAKKMRKSNKRAAEKLIEAALAIDPESKEALKLLDSGGSGYDLLRGGEKYWKAEKGSIGIENKLLSATGASHSRAYRKVKKGRFLLEVEFAGTGHDKIIWIGDTSVVMRVNEKYKDILIGDGDEFGSLLRSPVKSYDLSVPDADRGKMMAWQQVRIKVDGKTMEVNIRGKETFTVKGDFTTDKIGFGVWHPHQTMIMKRLRYRMK